MSGTSWWAWLSRTVRASRRGGPRRRRPNGLPRVEGLEERSTPTAVTLTPAGDATWLNTFYNTQTWATPGGDFAAAASATKTVNTVGKYTWIGLAGDVQGWLNSPSTNLGWLLTGPEGGAASAKQFDTRENS